MKNKQTGSAFKALAVIGFGAIIIIVAWVSIQLVNLVPEAFSSLASLREAMNQQSENLSDDDTGPQVLSVTSDSNVINTTESVNLTWDTANVRGTYTFSFACEEGVSLTLVDSDTEERLISCDTNYNIGNTNSLTLEVESEKNRFAEVDYKIGFLATNDMNPRAEGSSSFTVINDTIPDISLTDDDNEVAQTEESVTPANPNPSTSSDTVTTPSTPTYEQEFVYTIPTSDPNGRTDLGTRYLFAGNIVGNQFVPGAIDQNDSGAVQFEVKNYGSKSSEEWTYSMTLPNGGEFESDNQDPLKPNERAVITIGFPTGDDDDFSFEIKIDSDTDRNPNNDDFTQTVNFLP